jgi:hypothetical protein
MASDVTIHSRPRMQITLPPLCCYCLEPATTTYPVLVWRKKIRTGPHTKVKMSYPIQVPYCAAHGREARLFGRYDRASTIVLFIAAAMLLIVIDLTLGRMLRTIGEVIWWCSTVLVMALLAIGGVGIHAAGRKLLQRRHPAMAGHYYTGSLGVKTHTRVARQPAKGSDLILAVTFTFSNDDFAARVAALHATESRAAPTA